VKGSNAEQRLDTKVVFDELVKLAYTMTDKNLYAGGNALTMARRIAIERQALPAAKRKDSDQKVVLLAQIDNETTSEMQGYGIQSYGPIPEGSNGKSPDKIDIHFALEYQTGDTITIGSKSFSSPRMNRYYMNSDEFNTKLKAADAFSDEILSNNPFLIISGLQVLDRNDFKAYSMADPAHEMAKYGTVHGSTAAPSTSGSAGAIDADGEVTLEKLKASKINKVEAATKGTSELNAKWWFQSFVDSIKTTLIPS
jgi:hypothetical protein